MSPKPPSRKHEQQHPTYCRWCLEEVTYERQADGSYKAFGLDGDPHRCKVSEREDGV